MNQDNRQLSSPETVRRANITFPPPPRPPVIQAVTRFAPDIPQGVVADYTAAMTAFREFSTQINEVSRNMQNIDNPRAHMRQIIELGIMMRGILTIADRVTEGVNSFIEERRQEENPSEPLNIRRGV